MSDTPSPMPQEESKGSLIGSVIIVLILIIGAVYLYFNRNTTPITPEPTPSEEMGTPEPVAPSDDVSTLEMDASSTQTADLDASLDALDKDFQ